MISREWGFERHLFLDPFYHFLFLALQERLKFGLVHSSQLSQKTTKPCDRVESPLSPWAQVKFHLGGWLSQIFCHNNEIHQKYILSCPERGPLSSEVVNLPKSQSFLRKHAHNPRSFRFLLVVGSGGCSLGDTQSLSPQEYNRMHSCGNHIMSCEIMIFNETPLSAVQMRVWHPPEQAETFPDWLSHLYWSGVSFNP